MTLARFSPTDLLNAVGLHPSGWRGKYPKPRQIAVFRDREIPLPATRGEASDILKVMAKEEGWGANEES